MPQQDGKRSDAQGRGMLLAQAADEQKEWNEEVEQRQQQSHWLPRAFDAVFEPDHFFRKVGVPDEQVLREADVRKKHRESEAKSS
jgi:hypothetical protein